MSERVVARREGAAAFISRLQVWIDGGAQGNPGPGSIGVLVYAEEGRLLHEYAACIGHCTNNQAEYRALMKGLDLAAKYTRGHVSVYSDSELVVKQMNKAFRLKDDELRALFQEVKDRERVFDAVVYQHVSRGHQRIAHADRIG